MQNQNQNQTQNQNLQDLEREASQRPDYDRSDQSMHHQEIEKSGGKSGMQSQKSDTGRSGAK